MQAKNEERKEWDTYALKLETVDRDPQTGSEVVHWVLKYPVSELPHMLTVCHSTWNILFFSMVWLYTACCPVVLAVRYYGVWLVNTCTYHSKIKRKQLSKITSYVYYAIACKAIFIDTLACYGLF